MGRICLGCKQFKPSDEFSPSGDTLRSRCKECRNADERARKYGVTAEWFEASTECAICGKPPPLVVDHDHSCCPGPTSCGLCVRDLICQDCNSGLGFFHDDPDVLTKAVEYLDQHQPWEG